MEQYVLRGLLMPRRLLGRYIVRDPEVCHGKPTFVGTRILVSQVLRQIEKGMSWDTIIADWRGSVPREAIAEAIKLAANAFLNGSPSRRRKSQPT
jgi:uncharacterized protein (DUF433 family)